MGIWVVRYYIKGGANLLPDEYDVFPTFEDLYDFLERHAKARKNTPVLNTLKGLTKDEIREGMTIDGVNAYYWVGGHDTDDHSPYDVD